MSISRKTLGQVYGDEGLSYPDILAWPLEGDAEIERSLREKRFLEGTVTRPPEGLEWMASHAVAKYRPDRVLEGCRSVLVTSLGYFRDDPADREGAESRGGRVPSGRIARYARGRDYHKELGGRLRRIARRLKELSPDDGFRSFVDIGPLDERWLAEASGAGFLGRNGLVILRGAGSWAVLGHIVTTHSFPRPPRRPPPRVCPDGCRRCIEACPADALTMPGLLDASRCLSTLTIERKGVLPEEFRAVAGDRVFGCDVCQEVCPFNARIPPADVAAFSRDIAGASVLLAELLALRNHDDVTDRFAGSPLMRAGRAGLVRNACTAAGNLAAGVERTDGEAVDAAGLIEIVRLLVDLVDDEDEGVRVHARWALERLRAAGLSVSDRGRRPRESG